MPDEELANSQERWLALLESRRGQQAVLDQLVVIQNDVAALHRVVGSQKGSEVPESMVNRRRTSTIEPPVRSSRVLAHPPRILFVRFDAAMESHASPFTVTNVMPAFGQIGSMTSTYMLQPPRALNGTQIGTTIRLWRHFAVGATRTRTKSTFQSAVQATIPPVGGIYSRSAEANYVGLHRSLDIVHLEVTATAGGDPFELAVYAGPSRLAMSQELMTGITLKEAFGSAAITAGQSRRVEGESVIGFNLGFDVTWFFLRYFGFGGGVRYSRAVATVNMQARPAEIVLGGVQLSIGARARF